MPLKSALFPMIYLFLGTSILLFGFHREQPRDRWLSAHANGMRAVKEVILTNRRPIASAETLEEYQSEVNLMKDGKAFCKFAAYLQNNCFDEHL